MKRLKKGSPAEAFHGSLRNYLDNKLVLNVGGVADDIRVLDQNIFLFKGATLITAWPPPARFRNERYCDD